MRSAEKHNLSGSSDICFRGHMPALDGLRGVAVLVVLIRHFYLEEQILAAHPVMGAFITKFALAGNYGVELFFVLSGFLITGILLDSRGNSNYFRAFYARRFLRIFPLYYAVLCILFLVLPQLIDFDAPARDIAARQGWLWSYLSNAPWSGGGWDESRLFRLGHFWSLCVEEHFYIVWPLLVYIVSPKALAKLCLGCIGLCVLLRLAHSLWGFPLLGWTSLTKLDGLAVGSLLAVVVRNAGAREWLYQNLLRLLLISSVLFFSSILVPRRLALGWYWGATETISVIFFGAVLSLALRNRGWFPFAMNNSLLRSFGKYSYALYVIHNVCLPAFEGLFKPQAIMTTLGSPLLGQAIYYILTISASFILALGSWHLLEKHFLKLKRHFMYNAPAPSPSPVSTLQTETR